MSLVDLVRLHGFFAMLFPVVAVLLFCFLSAHFPFARPENKADNDLENRKEELVVVLQVLTLHLRFLFVCLFFYVNTLFL
jgi:hypothetical protein